ncbi:hypothetical protein BG000_003813 [Podila horticola]|nr:hypothetical protein BG000_003813 [Podila horticola]
MPSPIILPNSAEDLEAIAQNVVTILQRGADQVVAIPEGKRSIENTLLALQEAQSEAACIQTLCTFPAMVHMDKDVRVAATEAKKLLQKAWSSLFSRRDIYMILSHLHKESLSMDVQTCRLLEHTLRLFRRHGSALSQEGQERLMAIRSDISSKELDFQKNLNEDMTDILLTRDELEGCSEAWLSGLKTDKVDGHVYYRVTMKTPDILNVSKNASLPLTRKRVLLTYRQVCTSTNGPILEHLIKLRHEAATLLGYKHHAAYQLEINMARTVETVETFLDNITTSIASKLESDRQELLDLKKAEYQRRGWSQNFDGELQSSDVKYYQELLFKEKYAVDNNLIQEYFPLDHVRDQILGIYAHIFQLRFQQIPGKYWADDVTLFAVYDQKAQNTAGEDGKQYPESFKIGYFFFGKYAHQCVVPLRPSYVVSKTGEQVLPIEVPSIMLENWLWEPAVLRRLSKHYKTGSQLPEDIIQSLTRTRKVSAGLKFSQQIAVTAVDLKLHMVDPNDRKETIPQIWKEMTERLVGIKLEDGPGSNPAAQFYHIAMGYDAGYYVYAWSEMHAHDLFTRFSGDELSHPKTLDSKLGREYWEKILVPGASVDAIDLLRDFLGREPSPAAFQSDAIMYKHLSAPTLPEASQTVTKAEQIGPYDLRETLGVGAYAVKTGVKAAVKIIPKDTQEMKMIQKELTIQRGLQHRNISRFLESRESPECLYIFVEYAAGGELFDKIGTLKISDFGLATVFRHGGRTRPLETPCGSAPYVAPEVLQEEYCGDMVDIWSCGVILYVMMIGNTPWDLPSSESEEFSRYEKDNNPTYEPWNRLQGPVRKLLLGILRVNPTKRMTIKEITKDAWYKRPNPLVTDGFVNNPAQLASMLMENVEDTTSPIVAYSQPLQTGRIEQSQYPVHDYRNYASSQPARNNERASDSSLGARIAISWQTEALELSQPATQFTEATFLQVFSSERLTRFFSETPADEIIDALDDAMVHNLVAHTVQPSLQKITISTTDQRRCFLTGEVKVVPYGVDTSLVMFDKSRGDPLEWKRMFKALVATLQDSENPIHLQMNP